MPDRHRQDRRDGELPGALDMRQRTRIVVRRRRIGDRDAQVERLLHRRSDPPHEVGARIEAGGVGHRGQFDPARRLETGGDAIAAQPAGQLVGDGQGGRLQPGVLHRRRQHVVERGAAQALGLAAGEQVLAEMVEQPAARPVDLPQRRLQHARRTRRQVEHDRRPHVAGDLDRIADVGRFVGRRRLLAAGSGGDAFASFEHLARDGPEVLQVAPSVRPGGGDGEGGSVVVADQQQRCPGTVHPGGQQREPAGVEGRTVGRGRETGPGGRLRARALLLRQRVDRCALLHRPGRGRGESSGLQQVDARPTAVRHCTVDGEGTGGGADSSSFRLPTRRSLTSLKFRIEYSCR